jgi:UTP--glucose-1-phosphate uridylyltransferase
MAYSRPNQVITARQASTPWWKSQNLEDAPSNLAAIGRYIFTPRIFSLLEGQQKGAGGEIQVTDAMVELLKEQPIFSYKFNGTRFDCGDKAGFQMANLAFALEHPEIKETLREYIENILMKKV